MKLLTAIINNNLARKSLWVTCLSIASSILALGQASVLTRAYAPEQFSLIALFLVLMNFSNLLSNYGESIATTRALYSRKDSYVRIGIRNSLKTATLTAPLALAGAGAYGFWSKNWTEASIYAMAALMIPAFAIDRSDVIFQAKNKFYISKILACGKNFLLLVFAGIGVLLNLSLIWQVVFMLLISYGIAAFGLKIAMQEIQENANISQQDLVELKKDSTQFSMVGIFNTIVENLDRFVLSWFNPAQMAYLHVGKNIPFKFKDFIKMIALVPEQHWLRKGADFHAQKIKKYGSIFMVTVFFICVSIAALAPFFIPFLFGKQYVDAIMIAQLTSATIFFRICATFLETRVIVYGKSQLYRNVIFSSKILYLALLIGLIFLYQAIGAVWAMLLSDCFNFFAFVYVYRRETRSHLVAS